MTLRQRKIEELARELARRRTRAERTLLSFKTQAMQQGAESEPVQAYLSEFLSFSEFLSKMGTHLLASLGGKGKNGNSLAWSQRP